MKPMIHYPMNKRRQDMISLVMKIQLKALAVAALAASEELVALAALRISLVHSLVVVNALEIQMVLDRVQM